jgi:hypothetical protein
METDRSLIYESYHLEQCQKLAIKCIKNAFHDPAVVEAECLILRSLSLTRSTFPTSSASLFRSQSLQLRRGRGPVRQRLRAVRRVLNDCHKIEQTHRMGSSLQKNSEHSCTLRHWSIGQSARPARCCSLVRRRQSSVISSGDEQKLHSVQKR